MLFPHHFCGVLFRRPIRASRAQAMGFWQRGASNDRSGVQLPKELELDALREANAGFAQVEAALRNEVAARRKSAFKIVSALR